MRELGDGKQIKTFAVTHYDIVQRWIVVKSAQAKQRASKSLSKRVRKEDEAITKELFHLQAQRFSCAADGQAQLAKIIKKWKYHLLATSELVVHEKHAKRGRPKKGAEATGTDYQIVATYSRNEALIAHEEEFASCYVVATNAAKEVLSDGDAVNNYSEQNQVERGFRFLKDPFFFVSSLFVKKPSRICGLLMVMSLALLIYSVAERQMRRRLAELDETLPNQINQPTKTPTLRWVFQMLWGISIGWLNIDGAVRCAMTGLDQLRKKILSLFNEKVLSIYQISTT